MSADEIDAELLAMAGDSSDEDEMDAPGSEVEAGDRSPSQEAKPSVEKKEETGGRAKGVAQKVRKRGGRKKKREESEEDDFGEISEPSSPRSPAMDPRSPVSDRDAPASSLDDDAPLYPVDGKFVSEREREEILNKPEIEREQILAEREEAVQKRQQDLQLKRLLAKARQDGEKVRKRTATAAELGDDDEGTRSRRPKAEPRGKSALDAYKQAREAKGADRTSRLDTGRGRRDERSPSSAGSDRDADAESEVEWAEPSSERRERDRDRDRDEPPPVLRDFEHCRVGRSNFARICFWPGFEETIKSCFVRASIGTNRDSGQNMYRMAQIKGFTEGRPYQLEGQNGKTFTTDQYAVLSQGTNTKPFPFSVCSDSKFTDQEYDRYTSALQKDAIRIPSRRLLGQKLDDIHRLLNRAWTDAEISERLSKTNAMRLKYDPANQHNTKKDRILKDRRRAEDEGDEEGMARFDAELAALENSMNGTGISGGRSSAVVISKHHSPASTKPTAVERQDKLAQLNKLNKQRTAEEVRKALVEEKKKLHKARERAAEEGRRKKEEELARAEAEKARKLLRVEDDHDLFGSDISRTGTPQPGGTPRRSRAGTPMNGLKKEKSGLGLLRKKGNLDDEVIAGMDLDIDIEI